MRGLHSLGSENLKSDGFVLETVTILCGYMPFGFGNPCGSWHETGNVVSVSAPGCNLPLVNIVSRSRRFSIVTMHAMP